jgi:GNAT superfamily N-acetyltransferase
VAAYGRTRKWPEQPGPQKRHTTRRSGGGLLPAGFVPGAARTIGDVAEAVDRMPVPALMVSHLCVDQRLQGRGLGTQLMLHALELAAAVASAVGARLVVGHGGTERATGFLRRFGFRAFDTDPRWCNLPMQDVEATVSARATPPQTPPPPPLVDQDQTAGPTHRTDDGESDVDLERCVLDCVKTLFGVPVCAAGLAP